MPPITSAAYDMLSTRYASQHVATADVRIHFDDREIDEWRGTTSSSAGVRPEVLIGYAPGMFIASVTPGALDAMAAAEDAAAAMREQSYSTSSTDWEFAE